MLKRFYNKVMAICKNAVLGGADSPSKLALSFATGLYVAFSPFPGFHTVMILACKWFLGFNFPMMLLSTNFNNPWTMIPVYSLDYVFGYWLVHNLLGWNPGFTVSLGKYLGESSICLWSFLIGGNLLGVFAAIISYPLCKGFFERLLAKKKQPI